MFLTSQAGAEKKAIDEANKAVSALLTKLRDGNIKPEVSAKAMRFAMAVQQGDFAGATAVQRDLATKDWDTHRDWIQGLKKMLSLAQKKLR